MLTRRRYRKIQPTNVWPNQSIRAEQSDIDREQPLRSQ